MSEPGIFEHMCRTCLSTDGELVSIFSEEFYVKNLPEKIMAFTSIKISDQDCLPKTMCKKCIFLTDLLHCFKEQCESAERRLRNHLKGNTKLCLEKYYEIDKFPDGTKLIDNLEPNIVRNNSKEDTENTIKKENEVSIKAMSLNGKDEIATEGKSANEKFKSKEIDHHINYKGYHCTICSKRFTEKRYLATHMHLHTGNYPYSCKPCNSFFINKRNWKRHMVTTHERRITTECNRYNKKLPNKRSLQLHMRMHTAEKPYPCPHCSKAFSDRSNLKRHINSHLNNRQFLCSYCGKGFNESGTRNTHILTHTGEKPHQCSHCNARFTVPSTLKRHMQTHLKKAKPYHCKRCNLHFIDFYDLRKHLSVRHNEVISPYVLVERLSMISHVKDHSSNSIPHAGNVGEISDVARIKVEDECKDVKREESHPAVVDGYNCD